MKFLQLNKKRHAVRTFNDQELDIKDVRTAIEIATLAPSASNIQPWKFVIVKDKIDDLAQTMYGHNADQAKQAQYVIAIFADTELTLRARKIARIGVKDMTEEQLQRYIKTLPAQYETYSEEQISNYLALNTGLVAMNLALALTDQNIASNMILGFDKSQLNSILEIDSRFRPELLLTVGYSDEQPQPTYRLPVDELIELR